MPIKNSSNISLTQTTLNSSIVSTLWEAPDNAISNGISFDSWSVDGGSSKSYTGITIKQGTDDYAQVDVPNLTPDTLYWGMINISSKSSNATGSLRIIQSPLSGSNFHNGSSSFIDLSGATVGYPYYFRIQTDSSTGSLKRVRIAHMASAVNETFTFSDFRIFLTSSRSSAKIAVLGDRAGGFSSTYASVTNRSIGSSFSDIKNVIVMGDQADTSNPHLLSDTFISTGCSVNIGSAIVSASIEGEFSTLISGSVITASGILSGSRISSVNSSTQLSMNNVAVATNSNTSITVYGYLRDLISGSRGGGRYITVGNHDYDGTRETEVDDYFQEALINNNNSGLTYYSKVLGECEFFFINDNDAGSGATADVTTANAGGISTTATNFRNSTMGQWIATAIGNSTARWKIVVIHHACYSSSSTGAGWASNRWDWSGLGIHLVLQAHNHGIERIYKDGIYFYTIAMGGGNHHGWAASRLSETMFRLDSIVTSAFSTTYGYLKINDTTNDLVLEYYDSNHNLLDRSRISRT